MRAKEFLLEYSRQVTAQKFGPQLYQTWARNQKQQIKPDEQDTWVNHVLERLEMIDPTPHKEYTQWLVKAYLNGAKYEDLSSRGKAALARFQKLKIKKQLQPADRDINRLRSLSDLEGLIERYPNVEQTNVNKGKAIEWYKDNDLRIVIPGDEAAACYYGQGTRWCTAARENNMFDTYDSKGKLYIIFPLRPEHTGEKYQFHFTTSSFMDEKDNPADMGSLLSRYPQLKTIFNAEAKQHRALSFLLTEADVEQNYDELMNYVSDMMYNAGLYTRDDLLNQYPKLLKTNRIVYNKFRFLFSDQDDTYNDAMMDLSLSYLNNFIRMSESALSDNSDELQDFLLEETYSLNNIIDFIAALAGDDSEDVQMDAHYNLVAAFHSSIRQQLPKIIKAVWPKL